MLDPSAKNGENTEPVIIHVWMFLLSKMRFFHDFLGRLKRRKSKTVKAAGGCKTTGNFPTFPSKFKNSTSSSFINKLQNNAYNMILPTTYIYNERRDLLKSDETPKW